MRIRMMALATLIALSLALATHSQEAGDTSTEETPVAAAPTGRDLLANIDANEVADSRTMTFKMIINRGKRRKPKELTMKAWIQGRDSGAMEVVSGPDKGTRYLRLGDELWIASREAEKPMKISGHMLRQGMLDSDMSYEDSTKNKPLVDRFDAEVIGTEVKDGYTCWVLTLKARDRSETYSNMKLWVDQNSMLPVYQELMALSGMLLKTITYEELKQTDGRWVAMKMTINDVLKKKTYTVVEITEIEFDVEIDKRMISLEFVENVR